MQMYDANHKIASHTGVRPSAHKPYVLLQEDVPPPSWGGGTFAAPWCARPGQACLEKTRGQ